MNKGIRSQAINRFAQLAALGEVVFHVSDAAALWGITDKNTLHTTLARYAKQGLIFRLWRGMYSVRPVNQLDPIFLGMKAIHAYAYISMETVLFQHGIINQKPTASTFISIASRRFRLLGHEYVCRKLADAYLYQSIGVIEEHGIRKASIERAIADMLYFNPKAHFDAEVDWDAVRRIQTEIGYPLTLLRYA
jgi:predicted transcriptional regulator of viral defense system